ncbi:hypothetical protein [Haliovirga abyssi]|uniref:Uncharacterized protein n=1 Tax=Haliovirga abyssi TaxID=2996794 RepID=A0AAU9E2R8_9FUSO|nr:hypothetical protein [Haliovirga abyssi]BDU50700.1 hypothetical protein HLVA_12690 [Haliovirga abyssi]
MFNSKYCEVDLLEKEKAVYCKWKKFCEYDNYRKPLIYGLKLIQNNNLKNWITYANDGFENNPDDTEWLLNEFSPKIKDSTCKNIFFIVEPNNKLIEEVINQKRALSKNFNVEICNNINEVRKLIKILN